MKDLKELLADPRPETRPWAMWIWNGGITREEMERQLNGFADRGFGGVALRPGRDMDPPYLSEEFFGLFAGLMELAHSRKLGVRIADDLSVPWNGFFEPHARAGSKLRAQKLVLVHSADIAGGESFAMDLDDPDRYIILAASVVGSRVDLATVKTIAMGPGKQPVSWKAPAGTWRVMVFKKQWVLGPAGNFVPNVYNPKVAHVYIQSVLDELLAHIPKAAHGSFEGLVTEMPSYVPGENGIPWDDELVTRYRSKYKKEIVELLPSLFFEVAEEDKKNRAHVYSFLAYTMYERYASAIEAWAVKNKLSQWVLAPERDVASSSDMLRDGFVAPTTRLACTGIQNQEGSEEGYLMVRAAADMNLSEPDRYSVTVLGRNRHGNSATLQSLKTEADLVALIGPSRLLIDGCFFNLDHRAAVRTPYNPSWYSPDWGRMGELTAYLARIQSSISDLQRTRSVAVVMPTNAIMADYLPSNDEASRKGIQVMGKVVRELQRHNIEYDIISESAVLSATVGANGDFALTGAYKGVYDTLILPYQRLISKGLFVFLEKFALKKGTVVLVDQAPEGNLDDGVTSAFTARVDKFLRNRQENVSVVPAKEMGAYLAKVEPFVKVSVSGKRYPDIWVARGNAKGRDHYILHNTSEKRDCFALVKFPAAKHFYLVDCTDGSIHEIKDVEKDEDGGSVLSLNFAPRQTYVIAATAAKLTLPAKNGKSVLLPAVASRSYRIILKDQWEFKPDTPNILPLAAWNTRIGLSRESGGFSHYCESYFEVGEIPDTCLLTMVGGPGSVTGCSGDAGVELFINGTLVEEYVPAGVKEENQDELPPPPEWESFLGTSTPKYDIRDLLIRGFNRVSVRTVSVFAHPPTVLYPLMVAGSFSISRGAKGWIIGEPKSVIGYESWTRQGYPYLSGAGLYSQGFEVPTDYQRIMLRFSQTSGGIDVWVNDKEQGTYSWNPMELDITKACVSRRNLLTVRVRNTLDNLLRMNARPSGLIGEAYLDIY